jgi:hypothetical protein
VWWSCLENQEFKASFGYIVRCYLKKVKKFKRGEIKIHYIHVRKYHSKTSHFVQLIYAHIHKRRWLSLVIPATREVEIKRTMV